MLTLPPYTLRRLLSGEKTLWIWPMEPQPVVTYPVADDDPYFRIAGDAMTSNLSGWIKLYAPHRVGDVVEVKCWQKFSGKLVATQGITRDCVAIVVPATVTAVEAKRVRDVTHEEALAAGFLGEDWVNGSPYINGPNANSGTLPVEEFEQWWNAEHPAHPFDTAWAWVLGLGTT